MAFLFSHSGLSQITTLPNLLFRLSLFHTQQLTFQPTTQRKYKYEFILSKATLSTINLSMFAHIVNSCSSLEAEGPTLYLRLILPPMFWGLLCLSTQGYYYHRVGLHCLFRPSLLYQDFNLLHEHTWLDFHLEATQFINLKSSSNYCLFFHIQQTFERSLMLAISSSLFPIHSPNLVHFSFYLESDLADSPLISQL